ncbi:MAG: hypothetical protein WCF33_12895, partial [Pseudonocardiaceae bacterium]
MGDDVDVRQELLGRIRARRVSINTYVREKRPLSKRLANISIVSSAVAAALTAGPAAGGTTFAETVQKGLGWGQLSSVWRLLCLAALIVSLVAAISANLNKSDDLTVRISAAETCNADLEGLQALIEFGELSAKDAVILYRQFVAKIPFVEEDLTVDVNMNSKDTVTAAAGAPLSSPTSGLGRQWRTMAFLLPAAAIVLAGLVLLITVIGLFLGLGRPHSPLPSSVAAIIPVGTGPVGMAVTPDSGHAYVTNAGSGSVSVVDLGSNTVTATIPVG